MGWIGGVVCQGFLVREACVGVLLGGAGFFFFFVFIECTEVSSNEL